MKNIEIADINEKLRFCTCDQGCHLCSGSQIGQGSMLDYYKYFKKCPDYKNQYFNNWLRGYAVTDAQINEMEQLLKQMEEMKCI